jgi:hypothetical protein
LRILKYVLKSLEDLRKDKTISFREARSPLYVKDESLKTSASMSEELIIYAGSES